MLKNRFGGNMSSGGGTSADPKISAISGASDLDSSTSTTAATAGATTEPNAMLTPYGDSALLAANQEDGARNQKKKNPPPPGTYEYTVKEGDRLRSLAARFDTTPSVLKKLNRLTMDFLYPGQVLRIPDVDYVILNTKPNPDKSASLVASAVQSKDAVDVELPQNTRRVFPGRIIRTEGSCHSIVDESELAPKPLSVDEAEYLDQECFERFIKLNSFYMTEHNGPVDGVLLVTPNAVMFDPNVSNPLVIEKGAEEFGMIAKMDTIMSAAIYHDIEAMEYLQKCRTDPTLSKPPVYHAKEGDGSVTQEQEDGENPASAPDQSAKPHSPQLESISPEAGGDQVQQAELQILEGDSNAGTLPDAPNMPENSSQSLDTAKSNVSFIVGDSFILNPSELLSKSMQDFSASVGSKSGHESPSTAGENPNVHSANGPALSESTSEEGGELVGDHLSNDKAATSQQSDATCTESEGETPILGLRPSSQPAEFTAVEYDLANYTRSVGKSCFYVNSDTDVESDDVGAEQFLPLGHGGDSWTSSFSSSGESSASAGLTRSGVLLEGAVSLSDKPKLFESLHEMVPNGLVTDNPKQLAQETALYLCLKVGQHIVIPMLSTSPIETYSKKKRPEYWFSIPRDKVDQLYAFFIQWKSEVYDNDDAVSSERRFIAIKDDGQQEDSAAAAAAAAAASSGSSKDLVYVKHHFGRHISLDWEIVSWDEVRRRQTIEDMEKYVPLPELMYQSLILSEAHIKQLVKCLPARVEGYPWYLAFGSEQHGFSLKQLYRNMQNLDSAVLLVILTTSDQIFGAASSCPFHMSDLFYGTGESFLYTFVDGFKTYPWTGSNNFFNKGDNSYLSIGSGEGSYGLWIDEDLYLGRTQNCQTYANDPLTGGDEDFHIKQIEVWCFHDE